MAASVGRLLASGYGRLKRRGHAVTRQGEQHMSQLEAEAEIFVDRWGIPHVYASTIHDLFFLNGYVQAWDRLWQMDLIRRLATGRLTEDQNTDLAGFGELARRVNVSATEVTTRLAPESSASLEAFVDGINTYIRLANRLPLEFANSHREPEEWSVDDALRVVRLLALALASSLREGGSTWVFSGERTASGRPLLAAVSPLSPGLRGGAWYQIHLSAGEIDAIGATLPGLPVVVLGHNRSLAWTIGTAEVESSQTRAPADPLAPLVGLMRAEDRERLQLALRQWDGPAFGLVYADAGGNVGREVVGQLDPRDRGGHTDVAFGDLPLTYSNGTLTPAALAAMQYDAVSAVASAPGSAVRIVCDLANLNESYASMTGGQSGDTLSPHHGDLEELWRTRRMHRLYFARTDVVRHSESTLRLLPASR